MVISDVLSGSVMQQKRGYIVANSASADKSNPFTNFGTICQYVNVGDNLKGK
jgi:hypothetical protein